LTASADLAIRKVAEHLGVVAVLDKPVRKELLLNQVGQALSMSRLAGPDPAFVFHQRCSAKCGFSFGNFCSIAVTNILQ
jgi:hypothetical protein